MKTTIKIILGLTGIIIATDVFGLFAWILSGQVPADSFFIGTISAHIVRFLFF